MLWAVVLSQVVFSTVSAGCELTVWHSVAASVVAGMVYEPESSSSVVILPRPVQNLTVSDYRLVALNEASAYPLVPERGLWGRTDHSRYSSSSC